MQLVQKNIELQNSFFAVIKSFLLWSFTLTVCFLVVGFPVGVLVVTFGILSTLILQFVFPASAVLLVTTSLVAINVLTVLVGATILTFKGIHPQEVSWLQWLHGKTKSVNTSVYASCPLTCELN
ncbi:MAG: hypothetical protein AB4368_26080 [Xenococcaceae cyanobacterium]